MNLFMIGLGGKAPNCNIEVHDLQFVIANSIEETHDQLRENWYGIEKSLHMDSYYVLEGIEGYEITLKETSNESELSLYMINFGGYLKRTVFEIHEVIIVAATSEKEARSIAMEKFDEALNLIHVDNILKLDQTSVYGENLFIHLMPSDKKYEFNPVWQGYKKLST